MPDLSLIRRSSWYKDGEDGEDSRHSHLSHSFYGVFVYGLDFYFLFLLGFSCSSFFLVQGFIVSFLFYYLIERRTGAISLV